VLLHGGYFVEGTPRSVENRGALEASGARVVSLRYSLGGVAAAYRSASRRAARIGGRVVAVGESAGGTIAAWLAAHRRIDAAITIGAPVDLRDWPSLFPQLSRRIGISRNAWRLSPLRVYSGQRPLAQLQWTADPFVPFVPLRGAHVRRLHGFGHNAVPAPLMTRMARRACRLAALR
jgi:pimeloyl-ACP methyl ester carboxylesterase